MSDHVAREIGVDWRQSIGSWPVKVRERHALEVLRLISVGWNDRAAEFIAYTGMTDDEGRLVNAPLAR